MVEDSLVSTINGMNKTICLIMAASVLFLCFSFIWNWATKIV